ncbi:hypothetical protein [Microbacterium istanbulense]|uniref:Major facilitator superfamily (MFS) profile domain-containing protein n=1 Tax=Microbacterium istanbulense TaxID=3122049 RepID=A0ABU8LFE9_9MICO
MMNHLSSTITATLIAANSAASIVLLTSLGDLLLPRQGGTSDLAPVLFLLLIGVSAALIVGSCIGGLSARQRQAVLIVCVVAGLASIALSVLYFGIFLLDSRSVLVTGVFFVALFTASGPMLTSFLAMLLWQHSRWLSRRGLIVITSAMSVVLTSAQIAAVVVTRLMVAVA